MTSTETAETRLNPADLGTITVIGWAGENIDDGRDLPFLLAYTLGDGEGGPEAGERAVRLLLEQTGLPVGGGVFEVSRTNSPVSVLLESGSASVTMPSLKAQCLVPEQWTQAALKRGHVHFLFTTRPWPKGAPGTDVMAEDLKAFIGDEEVLAASAHCVVPVTTLRK
ncbi:DUF5949 family protein [Streptomyces sp. H27-C3]|uniref:DUF5949 family protein n=1 Tax=Streptomyces sp. H27-C3 TaxID=3046305 RepID=UPI0024BBBCDD|nr:DUF5949 family protein [Streptomyces sp. H27-C3]MDJ0460514.1 DUF5949 family protein [Streptomyces sp. H27-C3]